MNTAIKRVSAPSTGRWFSLSAGDRCYHLDLGTVTNQRTCPLTTTHNLAVDGDRDAARFNIVAREKPAYGLGPKGLFDPVEADHLTLRAKVTASSELVGARVTPWR